MKYDTEPEDYEKNDIIIYEDIDGNIDIDEYFSREQVEALKTFLKSIGKNPYYIKHPDSFENKKPFRNGKPFVMKKISHDINWNDSTIIKKFLISMLVLKKSHSTILTS